ncbi:precorrin-6A synthase (deacetylating) [Nakamurella leprariae]|uniref:Precorrin-6A synthase (Deacetylating) n=1 Tax=Nakamurella leprariae TaxID=2803911 RepID=A0A939BZW5_9ACTN|nr:precorrin-6A synthase (deacetylating) [Nakamurella leprariae]MBM9468146.1 precorrin-6A synthase (deacetylating) [Nakamurella leprariae]
MSAPDPAVRTLLLVGIGAGDPELLTLQAVSAIAALDVVLVLDKPGGATDLTRMREALVRRFAGDPAPRVLLLPDPPRDRGELDRPGYSGAVRSWHHRRADLLEAALAEQLLPGETAGILVWGDPAFYDSTVRLAQELERRGTVPLDWRVIPGISSIQLLAARHRLVLHGIGEPLHITTGRRLADAGTLQHENTVVMLDAGVSAAVLLQSPEAADRDAWIAWGAALGTPSEVLVAGRLAEVIDEIGRTRDAVRAERGWMMDISYLRRGGPPGVAD